MSKPVIICSCSALRIAVLLALLNFSPCFSAQAQDVEDPLEDFNRAVFWFNERVDRNVLGPIAESYEELVPKPVRIGVTNFFRNAASPVYVSSDLLQGKFEQAGVHSARFVINTIFGLGGLVDAAKTKGLEHHPEDIGIAFGYWGVGGGPYLVLPFLGPSNVRDFVGLVCDRLLSPTTYIGELPLSQAEINIAQYGSTALEAVDTRSRLTTAINSGREGSLDYYLFVRSSYHQSRQGTIYDGFPPDEFDDDDWED